MPTPIACLLAFTAWTLGLVFSVGFSRVTTVLRGEKRANEFPSGVEHGPERYWRLNRAHINAAENLPIFAVLVISSLLMGVQSKWLDGFALVVVLARVAQTSLHIYSGRSRIVSLRFYAFFTQWLCFVAMLVILVTSPHREVVHLPKFF